MISKGNHFSFTMALLGVTPLAIGALSMLIGRSILWYRFYYISELLLSIPLAIASLLITNLGHKNTKRTNVRNITFLSVSVAVLTLFMIMNPSVNDDNHVFSPNTGVRCSYIESEMIAASFFVQKSEKISIDYQYKNIFSYYNYVGKIEQYLDNSLITRRFLHDGSVKILRKTVFEKPFLLVGAIYRLDYDLNTILSNSFSKIYDNSEVVAFF